MCSECPTFNGRNQQGQKKKKNPHMMDINFSGWGYPLSQTFSSCFCGIAVEIGGSFWDPDRVLSQFPDDDDTAVDSSNIGMREYIVLSVVIEGVDKRW